MSLSRKSAHNSHSSPTLVVEMSSFNVEPKLQKVVVDSVYVTNDETVEPKGSEILQVAKVILQLVSMVFGLYLIIFFIMTGFSLVKPAPEYIPGTSFLNVPKVRVVDSPNVPFLLSESTESDLIASTTDESQDDESDAPLWATFSEDLDESSVSTQASITTFATEAHIESSSNTSVLIVSSTTSAPTASSTISAPTASSTISAPTASSTTSAPVRRQLPKRSPMSESFLKEFRNKTEETQLFLEDAEEYCLPSTSLADCELDWPKLRLHQASQVHYMNFSSFNTTSDTYDECFAAKEEITCFGPFNGTHTEVRLNELVYKPGTLEVDFIKEEKMYARYILAVGPEDYILVTGETPDQFCLLTLFDHSCQTYELMVGTMITS